MPLDEPSAIGRFEVVRRLGQGGMGAVYLAHDPDIDRLVAIKLMRAESNDPQFRERFRREARAIGRLDHPNIIRVFEFGEYQGQLFIAMEYLRGETLGSVIKRGKIATAKKVALIDEVCAGLSFAHRAGIIHRDIKPANVMVDAEARVKILDFGLARARADEADVLTEPSATIGSLNYMSPEQLNGEAFDRRTDIFSIGAVFYELLSGRMAFPGNEPGRVMRLILFDGAKPIEELCPGIEAGLAAILRQCLAREAKTRYSDLDAMRRDLANVQLTLTSSADPAPPIVLPGSHTSSGSPSTQIREGPAVIDSLLPIIRPSSPAQSSGRIDPLLAGPLISRPPGPRHRPCAVRSDAMTEPYTMERVQSLRRLTRAVSDVLREEVSGYLSTLAILFRPHRVLGQYIQGFEKEPVKGADRTFRDLHALHDSVVRAAPFSLARAELKTPLDVSSVTVELSPVEYPYALVVGGERRTILLRTPLAWALSYSGYEPAALPELLARRTGASDDVHQWLLHQLVLQSVVSNQPGVTSILSRLHFPVSTVTESGSGLAPLTRIASPLSTVRPPDDVIAQAVELSGMDAFEEVINVADIARMGDPLKDTLIELAKSHGEQVP